MTTEIKICGITNLDDARAAIALGADYLGFILYPKSPRAVAPVDLFRLLDRLDGACKAVGVFVNESRSTVETLAADTGLYAVQIHGDEHAEDYAELSVRLWRAIWVRKGACRPDPGAWDAERYVIDASVPGHYGGTGVTADWNEAEALAGSYPVMLSGGLTPENVADGIRAVSPLGVDVASGVEREPGRKDLDKLKAFFEALRTEEDDNA